MKISKRAPLLTLNNIDNVFNKIDQSQDVINLAGGTPLFMIPQNIINEVANHIKNNTSYFQYPRHTQGLLSLRKCIAADLGKEFGCHIAPENILITVGASAGLFATFQALLNPQEEVFVFSPFWFGYVNQIQLAGGCIKSVSLYESLGWDIDFNVLNNRLTHRTRLLLFTNPSSPTGKVFSPAVVERLFQFARQNNINIVADETYRHIVYDNDEFFSVGAIKNAIKDTIIIRSFSKDFSISGMRLGFIVGPEDIIKDIAKIHLAMNMSASVFSQELGLQLYKNKNYILREMRRAYSKRLDLVCEYLDSWPLLFSYIKPMGGFFVFPKYKHKSNSHKFFNILLKEAKIAVRPGADFGPGGEHHIRISFAYPIDYLHRAFKRLRYFYRNKIL